MDKAKITLSAKETELVSNSDWILTKNRVLQKVKWILEDVQSMQLQFFNYHPDSIPKEIIAVPPKISKGENYKGLPYLVLDHPRYFGKDDHFAIRSLFWWGNFFSVTLHLSGTFKKNYEERLIRSFSALKDKSYFIAVSDDQWEHHFEAGNYRPLDEMDRQSFANIVLKKEFIKLAKRFSFDRWEDVEDILFASFRELIGWLND